MENEYIVINKTELLKKMEDWVNKFGNEDSESVSEAIHLFQSLSSQSTPFIPEIKKAFDAGDAACVHRVVQEREDYLTSEKYISNLKLDI